MRESVAAVGRRAVECKHRRRATRNRSSSCRIPLSRSGSPRAVLRTLRAPPAPGTPRPPRGAVCLLARVSAGNGASSAVERDRPTGAISVSIRDRSADNQFRLACRINHRSGASTGKAQRPRAGTTAGRRAGLYHMSRVRRMRFSSPCSAASGAKLGFWPVQSSEATSRPSGVRPLIRETNRSRKV